MHVYIHDTLIPKMLEVICNSTTKFKLLVNYGLTKLCQETVGYCLIKLVFKYYYDVNNYYVGGHENKDMILYRWNFIDFYILKERCMFRWTHMPADESEHWRG